MWNDGGGFGGGYQSMDTSGFGEGGYMQDNQFASPTASSQEKKRNNKAQSVIPCTVKQLNSATYDQGNDVFKLEYAELTQVTLIGVIRSATESSTNIVYMVNDMTGDDIVVKKWINENEETEEEREKRAACRENSYVKITGNLKSFKENSRSVIAFNITPVSDFNQITHHLLEVIHAHLVLQKDPEATNNNPAGMTPAKGSFHGGNMMNTPGGNDSSFGGGNNLGLSGVQLQVHNIIASATSEEGMSLTNIRQKLRSVSEMQIRNAIEFLSNEGHIYSTKDDEHFKSTDSG